MIDSRSLIFFRNDKKFIFKTFLNNIPYIPVISNNITCHKYDRIVILNVVVIVRAFMIVKHSFRLFIVRLIHDLVLKLIY